MPGMDEVIFGPPVASVDVHDDGKGLATCGQIDRFWQAEFAELIRIGAVGEARVGWRRRQAEDIFGHAS